MAPSRLRAVAPSLVVLLAASGSLVCSRAALPARTAGGGLGDFLARSGATRDGARTFPPQSGDRTPRGDLGRVGGADAAVAIEEKEPAPVPSVFVVAGKELGYLPVAGSPRVIALHPSPGSRIGRATELSVLFDQPIDLGTAATLVKLTGVKGVTISSRLMHPIGPTFQGIKVDPRYVVLVRPTSALPAGKEIALVAADQTKERVQRSSDYTVVEPLSLRDVSCGWGSDDECSFAGGVLHPADHQVHVLFNNVLATSDKALSQRVRVTPPVKNLTVRSEGWDEGRIVIRGELVSSKVYEVAIDEVVDRFGQRLATPVRFKIETAPLSASASMPEGLILLDEATTKRFTVTTRNLESAELAAWPVPAGNADAFAQALPRVRARTLPEEAAPLRIPVAKQPLDLDPKLGPQEFTLEVDVADSSFRHIAGRAAVTMSPAPRYAGLKLAKGWLGVGEAFPVQLGVIDPEGQPVVGARVTAHVERLDWKYVQQRGAGGALRWDWTSARHEVGRCAVTSARTPTACSFTAAAPGDYEVTAEVDGRRGGVRSFWAWREGDTDSTPSPNRGRTLEISPDKTRYRPGDVAKLMVKSPYAAATAIFTVEQGGLLSHQTRKIQGGAALFEVPVTVASAPHVHATVTLLPIGAKGEGVADYRIGAVRIPVALEGARLSVALKSDKGAYEPGQEAEITVDVLDDGKPEAHAEIALAVVDEGVLRLTSFHALDPVPLLHPGRALSFQLRDSRRGLAEFFERSHTAGGQSRVAFPIRAEAPGEIQLAFAVAEGAGAALDRVEARVPVEEPGLDERPHLEGAFARSQEIALEIPADVVGGSDAALTLQVGQHLWPELGARLDYLLDYPHGCVEQTTSSTLPLIAARAILPRIGVTKLSEAEIKARIKAGLDRLATMRTESGGLAHWPGGRDPNVYGTAYAIRAVVLARAAGVEAPKGLLEGMKTYLADQLLGGHIEAEVQAAIAQSLSELGELPASAADALHDSVAKQSVFGKASLAIALHGLAGQEDRVASLLDAVEAGLDDNGELRVRPESADFYYYGSPTRSKAQAAIALSRLRPAAKVLPLLLKDLAEGTEKYTTQATAYSLLALAAHLEGATADGALFRVSLDGAELTATKDLGYGSKEFRLPLASLRGKKATLALASGDDRAIGFIASARWRRPISARGNAVATRTPRGPLVFRVFTTPKGGAVDLAQVHAGDVLRVAVLARLPVATIDRERLGYLALTDHLPAGFEPIQPDLATVASVPELGAAHPFSSAFRSGNNASHVELHDDRVDLYFDELSGDEVAATYLVRASTPGEFVLPPASAELMYEGDSEGYSDAGKVTVQ